MNIDKEIIKGHLAALTANILFGLNLSISKSLLESLWMTPMGFTYSRMFFGVILFSLISFLTVREKAGLRDLLIMAAGGLLGLAFAQLSFSIGIRYTSPVTWSLIAALGPIVVLLLSAVFLKDKISLKKAVGVIIGITGAVLLVMRNSSGGGASNSFLGIAIAMFSITSFSAYIVIMRKSSLKYAPITMMKWMFLSAFIFLSPLGIPELTKQRLFTPEVTLKPVLQFAYSVIPTSVVAFLLMSVAVKRIKATATSMYNNVQPLAASTAAIIIGQDIFTWDKPLVLLLILIGVFLVTRSDLAGTFTNHVTGEKN